MDLLIEFFRRGRHRDYGDEAPDVADEAYGPLCSLLGIPLAGSKQATDKILKVSASERHPLFDGSESLQSSMEC